MPPRQAEPIAGCSRQRHARHRPVRAPRTPLPRRPAEDRPVTRPRPSGRGLVRSRPPPQAHPPRPGAWVRGAPESRTARRGARRRRSRLAARSSAGQTPPLGRSHRRSPPTPPPNTARFSRRSSSGAHLGPPSPTRRGPPAGAPLRARWAAPPTSASADPRRRRPRAALPAPPSRAARPRGRTACRLSVRRPGVVDKLSIHRPERPCSRVVAAAQPLSKGRGARGGGVSGRIAATTRR
jgi:hypothetical protein